MSRNERPPLDYLPVEGNEDLYGLVDARDPRVAHPRAYRSLPIDDPSNPYRNVYAPPEPTTLANADKGLPLPTMSDDPIVWHEAAHALVGHRLGMHVEFIDMTGLLIPSPLCGLNVEPVPVEDRARVTGITALAGPVGESLKTGRAPAWRQDGEVARVQAKALASDMGEQMLTLIDWSRQALTMLNTDPAYRPLVAALDARRMLTGAEIAALIRTADNPDVL